MRGSLGINLSINIEPLPQGSWRIQKKLWLNSEWWNPAPIVQLTLVSHLFKWGRGRAGVGGEGTVRPRRVGGREGGRRASQGTPPWTCRKFPWGAGRQRTSPLLPSQGVLVPSSPFGDQGWEPRGAAMGRRQAHKVTLQSSSTLYFPERAVLAPLQRPEDMVPLFWAGERPKQDKPPPSPNHGFFCKVWGLRSSPHDLSKGLPECLHATAGGFPQKKWPKSALPSLGSLTITPAVSCGPLGASLAQPGQEQEHGHQRQGPPRDMLQSHPMSVFQIGPQNCRI